MSHEFLSSLHSGVFIKPDTPEQKTQPEKQHPVRRRRGREPLAADDRHRTIGISMSPQLREQAAARAEALGLPLSRYVQWCIEAELEGRPPQSRFERTG